MTVFNPHDGIWHYREIPVVCSTCGQSDTWTDLTQETKEALLDKTVLHSLAEELDFLERTAAIVRQFPETSHSLILDKLGEHAAIEECFDPVVDHLLLQDPELREFLTNSQFKLDARLDFVSTTVASIAASLSRDDTRCRKCGAYVYLPDNFYDEVGLGLKIPGDRET